MAGKDLEIVGERRGALDRRVECARGLLHRASSLRRLLEKVRSTHVADKDEVAAEHANRLVTDGTIGDEKGDVLRCVSRRVHHAQLHSADVERVPVAQQARAVRGRILVTPVVATVIRQRQARVCLARELPGARQIVRVDVRLGDDTNLHPPGRGGAQVRRDWGR